MSADAHGDGEKKPLNGLAVVGFVGVILIGILLIIYAARYVPQTLERLAGAVYLAAGETQNEVETPVVETPVLTPEIPSTPVVSTSTPTVNPKPTTGTPTYYYPPTTTQVPVTLYGRPDLTVEILAVGYLRNSSATSFVEDNTVSESSRPGLRFRVRNIGTNAITSFQVEVRYPAANGTETYRINSYDQLRPNGYKDYTFGFDNPEEGDQNFAVSVDPSNYVSESNEGNNRDSAGIEIGSGGNSSSNLSCDLSVSPSRIDDGERATLRWDTDGNPTSASINQGVGSVDEDGGSERVSPDEDTTYRLTIRKSGDEETCSVTLRVD